MSVIRNPEANLSRPPFYMSGCPKPKSIQEKQQKTVSKISLALIDKRLMRHVAFGGSAHDEIGMKIVTKFVYEALKTPLVVYSMQQYDFKIADLCEIYATSVDNLHPNPCIKAGGPMLAGSLTFIEPSRLEELLQTIHERSALAFSEAGRLEVIQECTTTATGIAWETHTRAFGEAKFETYEGGRGLKSSSGCLSVFLFSITLLCVSVISVFC